MPPPDDETPDEPAIIEGAPPPTKLLTEDDIRTGMNLTQTAYAVLMSFGLKVVAEAFYPVLFASSAPGVEPLSPWLIGIAFITVLLLTIRFFFVTRNLYAYVNHHLNRKATPKDTFRPLMLYHFPIAVCHSILFFGVCEAFIELTKSAASAHAPIIHFVGIYVTLLLLNSIWLYCIVPRDSTGPGRRVWAKNNCIFSIGAGLALVAFFALNLSVTALLVIGCVLFLANSVIDLREAAEGYILFGR